MKFLTLMTLFTTLFLGVQGKVLNFVEEISLEAFEQIPKLLGEHAWRINYEDLGRWNGKEVSEIKLAGIIEKMKNVASTRIKDKKKLSEIHKLYERTFQHISVKPVESERFFVTFNPQDEVLEFNSKVPVSKMLKNAAKKITSNAREVSPTNVIGDLAKRCTRSGCRDVTTAAKKTAKEVTKKSSSKLFEKLGTAITIGLAAYEGYGEYHENGDVGRAVVRTTASLGKNSLISAAMVPAAALCGPFAPACFIGGTVGISSYTPDAKWLTDKLYE